MKRTYIDNIVFFANIRPLFDHSGLDRLFVAQKSIEVLNF